MNDITKYSRDRKVRLQIWETNKGPALGYVYWRVQRLEDGLFWVTKREAGQYVTIDKAYWNGVRAFREVKRECKDETNLVAAALGLKSSAVALATIHLMDEPEINAAINGEHIEGPDK